MNMRGAVIGSGRIAVVLAALCLLPITHAAAQATSGGNSSDAAALEKINSAKVTLEVDKARTGEALHTLMKSAGASYVLDGDLGAGTVTAHLKDVAFKDALAVVVKVSTVPITYEIQEGIFHFKKKPEEPAAPAPADPAPDPAPQPKVGKIAVKESTANEVVRKLKGQYDNSPAVLPPTTITKPDAHGTISSSGSVNGTFFSNSVQIGPNGAVRRSSVPPTNVLNILRNLFSGHR